jgi:hypothetical protein
MNMNNSMHSLFQQDTAVTAAATSGNSNTASPRTARFTSSSSANNTAATAAATATATAGVSKQQEVDFIKLNYVLTRPPPAPEGSSQAKQKAVAAQEVTISYHVLT